VYEDRRRAHADIGRLNVETPGENLRAGNKEQGVGCFQLFRFSRCAGPSPHIDAYSQLLRDECGTEVSPAGLEYFERNSDERPRNAQPRG